MTVSNSVTCQVDGTGKGFLGFPGKVDWDWIVRWIRVYFHYWVIYRVVEYPLKRSIEINFYLKQR